MAEFADLVGIVGSILLMIAYFLLQKGTIKGTDASYLYLNLIGASFILFSLFFFPNRSAIIIEVFWVIISLYGLWKRKKSTSQL